MQLAINGSRVDVSDDWRDDSLLQVLREALGLVGAKFGCGTGLCGACTVLLNGAPIRSCITPVASVQGQAIVTIEGLAPDDRLHPVQRAWIEAKVSQCGYCQTGQIMTAVALLRTIPKPSGGQIDEALSGHLCRCGTQQRVREAIKIAAGM